MILLPFSQRNLPLISFISRLKILKSHKENSKKFPKMKLNFQKIDIEIPVEIPVNFMILTGTGIPANRLILTGTGTGILPGSRSILDYKDSYFGPGSAVWNF